MFTRGMVWHEPLNQMRMKHIRNHPIVSTANQKRLNIVLLDYHTASHSTVDINTT